MLITGLKQSGPTPLGAFFIGTRSTSCNYSNNIWTYLSPITSRLDPLNLLTIGHHTIKFISIKVTFNHINILVFPIVTNKLNQIKDTMDANLTGLDADIKLRMVIYIEDSFTMIF